MRMLYVCAALALAVLPAAHADVIPDWIREIAAFWSQGKISDAEFAGAIRYLSETGVITAQDAGPEAAELPFRITSQHTVSESGACEIVIRDAGRGIEAVTEPPGIACDIRVYEEAEGSMLGGIRAVLADGTHRIVYSPWNDFGGDVGSWDFAGIAGIEITYHDVTGSYADDYGTIFFDRDGVRTVQIRN